MEGDKTYFGLDNPTDMEIALHSFNDLVSNDSIEREAFYSFAEE
ncbi:hypothetical protein [Chamaesiphon sp. OTE_75_metabat_556]|nr:hypothetical protein [Chamaesiphon sp. OTE_75_metabat_556]